MTGAQLEQKYDELYAEADAILKQFNPCEHKDIEGFHFCLGKLDISQRHGRWGSNVNPACCCVGCNHWTPKGCGAEKPLFCKTWLCVVSAKKYPEIYKKLNKIRDDASKFNFLVLRGDKKESLEHSRKNDVE